MRRTTTRRSGRFDAYLHSLNDHDEDGWQSTCPRCGTNHDGWPPDTIGGIYRCRRLRAHRRATTTIWFPIAFWSRWRVKRYNMLIDRREQQG